MTDMLTCCPHCGTSFRTTEEQLQTAQGAVRCGSCLRIFKALDHLIEPLDTGEHPLDDLDFHAVNAQLDRQVDGPQTGSTAEQPWSHQLSGEYSDELGLSDASMEASETSASMLDNASANQDIDLERLDRELDTLLGASQRGPDTATEAAIQDSKEEAPATEPEAGEADSTEVAEPTDDIIEDTQSISSEDLSREFQQRGQYGGHPGALFDLQLRVVESQTEHHTDESWAVNLLEELQSEEQHGYRGGDGSAFPDKVRPDAIVGQFYTDPEPVAATDPEISYVNLTAVKAAFPEMYPSGDETGEDRDTASDQSLAEDDGEAELEALDSLARSGVENVAAGYTDDELVSAGVTQPYPLDPGAAPESANAQPFQLLREIAAEPVEIEEPEVESPPGARYLWFSLCFLACLTLALQYLWFRFDTLSQDPRWRTLLERACETLGCELSSWNDPAAIRASNLVVRTHPRIEGALLVDSVLLNTAPFDQTFPDFLLEFSDLTGTRVAARRFTPQEYLHGDLARLNKMPRDQPIHISLEIADPGDHAINYTASIPLDGQ